MKTIKSLRLLMVSTILFGLSSALTAQKVNSMYFLENSPIYTRSNPAMAPKYSGFGVGISSMSLYAQSDLAFDDIFYPQSDGSVITFLHPDADKTAFLDGLQDVTSLRTGMNLEYFTLGLRLFNLYFSMHSGINLDMGMGLPKDMFTLFMNGMDNTSSSTTFNLSTLNTEIMLYSKTGVGVAFNLGKLFSVGVNVDYLAGLAHAKVGFEELSIDASSSQWDVTSKGYIQMAGPDYMRLTYGDDTYLNGFETDKMSSITADMSSLPVAGSGFSVDLGITAKLLPFLKLSAAVSDLGAISWKKESIQKATSNVTYPYDGTDLALNNDEDQSESETGNQWIEELQTLAHFTKSTITEGYSTPLTTKMSVAAEAGILKNRITFGVLSQTGFASTGTYSDLMLSANLKPGSLIQTALTYSLLHGETSSFGAAINTKILFLNMFVAADYIPLRVNSSNIPISNSYFNAQFGFNFMF